MRAPCGRRGPDIFAQATATSGTWPRASIQPGTDGPRRPAMRTALFSTGTASQHRAPAHRSICLLREVL